MPTLSRIHGCLLGGAIGDALGVPVEFIASAAAIRARYGDLAHVGIDYGRGGEISDDTQMTLFTAEGLLAALARGREKGIVSVPAMVTLAYLRWDDTQRHLSPAEADAAPPRAVPPESLVRAGWLRDEPRLYARRAPGNTCLTGLADIPNLWPKGRLVARNHSKGCGGVMRVAPCGLVASTREQAYVWGAECAAITHGHPAGYLSAAYLAALVFDLVRDVPLREALAHADALLREPPACEGLDLTDSRETAACLARVASVANADPKDAAAIESLGGGWVGEEALAIAIACALPVSEGRPEAIAEALARAATHAGDSDSTACIAGNLLGARFGLEALPRAWAEGVELADVVERLAKALHEAAPRA